MTQVMSSCNDVLIAICPGDALASFSLEKKVGDGVKNCTHKYAKGLFIRFNFNCVLSFSNCGLIDGLILIRV